MLEWKNLFKLKVLYVLLNLIPGFVALQLPVLIASYGMANPQLYRIYPFELINVHETNILAEITRLKCNPSGNYGLHILSLLSLCYTA